MSRKNNFFMVICIIVVCITAIFFGISAIDFESEQPTIVIRGKKPEGAKVELWVRYFLSGDQCETYSYNLLKMERKRGGITKVNFTEEDNISTSVDEYKYEIRYQPYLNSEHCLVELASIQIKAYSQFDYKSGFAELDLTNESDERDSRSNLGDIYIEAKNCNADILQLPNHLWLGDVLCDIYVNDKLKEKRMASNYRTSFDFSKLRPNQEFTYNIIPGPDYKDGHFNEQTGKFEDE